jgi:uncharacterized protein YcfJ
MAPKKQEKTMILSLKTLSAAALAFAIAMPMAATVSSPALALTKKEHKYCVQYAHKKAKKKTDKAALTGLFVGGIGGALIGDAFGGKKTTILSGAGGAAAGLAVGGSQYNKYYDKYYYNCVAQFD